METQKARVLRVSGLVNTGTSVCARVAVCSRLPTYRSSCAQVSSGRGPLYLFI